jgi:hypothetical protein
MLLQLFTELWACLPHLPRSCPWSCGAPACVSAGAQGLQCASPGLSLANTAGLLLLGAWQVRELLLPDTCCFPSCVASKERACRANAPPSVSHHEISRLPSCEHSHATGFRHSQVACPLNARLGLTKRCHAQAGGPGSCLRACALDPDCSALIVSQDALKCATATASLAAVQLTAFSAAPVANQSASLPAQLQNYFSIGCVCTLSS